MVVKRRMWHVGEVVHMALAFFCQFLCQNPSSLSFISKQFGDRHKLVSRVSITTRVQCCTRDRGLVTSTKVKRNLNEDFFFRTCLFTAVTTRLPGLSSGCGNNPDVPHHSTGKVNRAGLVVIHCITPIFSLIFISQFKLLILNLKLILGYFQRSLIF
uniref:Secreted protein n=1 Tax=Oryza brachyantha TaxID=4533 RepID=J3LJQ4_ORYBR